MTRLLFLAVGLLAACRAGTGPGDDARSVLFTPSAALYFSVVDSAHPARLAIGIDVPAGDSRCARFTAAQLVGDTVLTVGATFSGYATYRTLHMGNETAWAWDGAAPVVTPAAPC